MFGSIGASPPKKKIKIPFSEGFKRFGIFYLFPPHPLQPWLMGTQLILKVDPSSGDTFGSTSRLCRRCFAFQPTFDPAAAFTPRQNACKISGREKSGSFRSAGALRARPKVAKSLSSCKEAKPGRGGRGCKKKPQPHPKKASPPTHTQSLFFRHPGKNGWKSLQNNSRVNGFCSRFVPELPKTVGC